MIRSTERAGKTRLTLILSLFFAFAMFAKADILYVGLTDQSFTGVATFTGNLGLIDQFEVASGLQSVAAGPEGTFFTSGGNTIRKLSNNGAVLGSISGSATTEVNDLSFSGTNLFATVKDQSFNGVARFTGNLGLLDQTGTNGGELSSISAISNDFYFTSSANSIAMRSLDGAVVRSISGSATTQVIDMSFFNNILYVALTDGSFNGVALFTATLGLINQLEINVVPSAITGAPGNTFFVGSGRQVIQFDQAANVLRTVSGSATTQIVDLSYFVSPAAPGDDAVPEPATLLLSGVSLIAIGLVRRKRT